MRPEVFWERLFFDADYNEALYRELRFERYEVLELERFPNGNIRRKLRAEPPLSGPDVLKRALRGHVYYIEEGTFDAARGVWEFVNHTSVQAGTTHVAGTMRLEPHPHGVLQVVELDVQVSAFGLGGLVERQIEKGTRESYRVATAFANDYARRHGLVADCA